MYSLPVDSQSREADLCNCFLLFHLQHYYVAAIGISCLIYNLIVNPQHAPGPDGEH